MEAAYLERPEAVWRQSRRLVSECWIYTEERGLREVTLHGNGSTLAVDGRHLYRWNVVDRDAPEFALALVYSAEMPSLALQERVAQAARERFKNEPGFVADCAAV
jgi:hypothetical protein